MWEAASLDFVREHSSTGKVHMTEGDSNTLDGCSGQGAVLCLLDLCNRFLATLSPAPRVFVLVDSK